MGQDCLTDHWSSRRFAIIVVKQAAKSLAALDLASHRTNFLARIDDHVVLTASRQA